MVAASKNELACVYAALILSDDGAPVTADKITAIAEAAGVSLDAFYPTLFAKACESVDIEQVITQMSSATPSAGGGGGVGGAADGGAAAPAAEEKEPEPEEEEEEAEFDLFD
uniref:60S acidic ribosomal protein P1 n=1 Tax=Erythrolobus madagascarensis TaxID=708628 RepID=A0A7S0T6B8_9RHOD